MAYVAIDARNLKGTTSVAALLRDRGKDVQRAVNEAGRFGFKITAEKISNEVRFPAGYLTSQDRLRFRQAYAPGDSAIISARRRATSLAQFVKGHPGFGQRGGLAVQVLRRGGHAHMSKAFLMRTKSGGRGLGNVGVMMREDAYAKLNKGRRSGIDAVHGNKRGYMETGAAFSSKYAWRARGEKSGLRPLYSVSVDQAFDSFRRQISQETQADLDRRVSEIFSGA
ncbi:hypothetical protein [Paenirhodobacter populi]|uniref:Uncharacterized protein n=1 Tax=Paenirhodobacter populi TaxID=2306993 RepID=A0A443J093_9RHOB|nr:hypothetical protein [Sinirhodobacter populi]RWR13830.1 hypothetical protein D2T33_05375 [Sinirhodobacter populi]